MAGPGKITTDLFSARFELDGDGYVFRASAAAPGYRVSAAERDRMVAEFARGIVWLHYAVAAALAIAVVSYVGVLVANGANVPTAAAYLWCAAAAVFHVIVFLRRWNAPARELRGRSPVLPGRSRPETRRVAFQRLTWKRLAGGASMALLMLGGGVLEGPPFRGRTLVWMVLGGLLLLYAAVQAVRKWLMERSDRSRAPWIVR